MAAQLDFQASSPLQENPAATKKRKRNNASEDLGAVKRGGLHEVNGNGLATNEPSLSDNNTFADPNSASQYPPHPSGQHDEASSNMLAAMHAQGHLQSYSAGAIEQAGFDMGSPTQGAPQPYMQSYGAHPATPTGQSGVGLAEPTTPGGRKPEVGTDEWHKVRRDNHKEVERRRRETINEGINELAKIVPGTEKNKGSILARTVTEIQNLRTRIEEYERQGGLHSNVMEQAVRELSSANDALKVTVREQEQELQVRKAKEAALLTKLKALGVMLTEKDVDAMIDPGQDAGKFET